MMRFARLVLTSLLCLLPLAAMAQAPAPAPAAKPEQPLLKPEELEALVAPIALYPDPLLSQVLIASTYPLEVVQGDRFATQNKGLAADQLKAEVDKQTWDDSIKSLVATPDVLAMMSSKLDWTQKLGDAVLAQQPDVMDAIQRLRGKAHANNKLVSGKEQTVTVSPGPNNRQVYAIEPTDPNTINVPYYDPGTVYGAWPYAAYPPYAWPAPAWIAGGVLATGVAFGAGYAVGRWASGGRWWGGGCNWTNNNININRGVNVEARNWQHNPQHRHGVRYNNANVRQQFARNDVQAGRGARQDFRGRDGQQVLNPGRPGGAGDRGPGGGDRAGAGDRAGVGDRGGAGDRAGAGDRGRPGGADRPGAGGRDAAGAGGRDRPQTRDAGGGRDARGGGGGQRRDTAFSGVDSGKAARAQGARGRQSAGGGGGPPRVAGGGGHRGGGFGGGGGGGFRGGGGGGFRGGGGRRSDVALKHDISLLGWLDNGLGFYRFRYYDDVRTYVGVMAQEVQAVRPEAVVRGRDGYLRIFYDKLGVPFQTYEQWIGSGGRLPSTTPVRP